MISLEQVTVQRQGVIVVTTTTSPRPTYTGVVQRWQESLKYIEVFTHRPALSQSTLDDHIDHP